MLPYALTRLAEEDLKDIARYTLKQWGKQQSVHYASLLGNHFRAVASGSVRSHAVSAVNPLLKVSRCEHHYVFYLSRDKQVPVIIAVLHERMDMLQRLKNRLD